MNTDMALQTGLEVWREEFVRRERDMGMEEIGHVSDRRLYRMALPGGMRDAEAEDFSHLSLCPVCMGKWAELRQAISDIEDSEKFEEDRMVSWGMLEAAATDKAAGPLRLRSGCGNFVLGVLPRMGDPENGMVTLEVVSDAASEMEGRKATVKDHGGRTILEGTIRQSRLARKIGRLSQLDLARWSVVVK